MTPTITRSNNSPDRFLSWTLIALFFSVAFYVIGFLILAPSIGSAAIPLATVPVLVIGWLWGWRAAIVASLLTIPFNVLFLSLSGLDGLSVIDDLGDILGIAVIVLVGGLIGFSRDLNKRMNQELLARQSAELELREHRDHLELVVETRTTELKQALVHLQQTLVREQELNELKSRFVGMVSHEYRSPLTSILSAIGILRRYGHKLGEADEVAIFQKVETSVRRMTQMLDDVLGFNKFEEETSDITLVPIYATAFCQQAIERARTAFHASQTFVFSSNDKDCRFMADSDLVGQAFFNLFSNAVRYSALNSTISVKVDCHSQHILIRIGDQGMGIPAAEQNHIFDPFYRAQNVENIAGTGLGLVASKHAIERHSGTLTFESEINKGTIFTIMLPRLHSPSLIEAPNPLSEDEKGTPRR